MNGVDRTFSASVAARHRYEMVHKCVRWVCGFEPRRRPKIVGCRIDRLATCQGRPPSSVRSVARRSSSRTPSARRRSQSALPPGNTDPRSRGPSKSPPVMGTVRRVPWGTAPMLCGVATVTRRIMSKRVFIIAPLLQPTCSAHSRHKGHQFGVHTIGVRPAQTVWTTSDFGEPDVLDHLGLPP